ncbi:MAG: histidine phosphatase family protein [Clostridia bacterium]
MHLFFMIISFIRHGSYKETTETENLTIRGKLQTKLAIFYLKGLKYAEIYTSPKKRCVQTADIISKDLGFDVPATEISVYERQKFNPDSESFIERRAYEEYMNQSFKSDNFETISAFIARIKTEIDKIADKHLENDENVIIVTHSCVLYALNSIFYNLPADVSVPWVQCSNCSIINFEIKKPVPVIKETEKINIAKESGFARDSSKHINEQNDNCEYGIHLIPNDEELKKFDDK